MTTKTKLEEIVTVFSGDSKGLDRTLKHIVTATSKAQSHIQSSVEKIAQSIENANPGLAKQGRIYLPAGQVKRQFPVLPGQRSILSHQMTQYQTMLKLGKNPYGRMPTQYFGTPPYANQARTNIFGSMVSGAKMAMVATGNLVNHFNRGFRRMWYDVRMLGQGFRYYFVAPLLAGLAASVYAFAQFEDKLNRAMSLFGTPGGGMQKALKDTIFGISRDSKSSPNELADMLVVLSSANYTAGQSAKMLGTIEKFYVASAMEDATKATELLLGSQSALGMRVEDTAKNIENLAKVGSLLATANKLASGSIEDFAEALTNKAASGLRMVGKDATEGLAILAAYAMQEVKGAKAGTQFAIMLRELQRTALAFPKQWKNLVGKEAIFDAAGDMQNLSDIVGTLSDRLGSLNDEQKRRMVEALGFNDRSQNAIMMLVGMGKNIKEFEKALRSSGDALEQMYRIRMQGFNTSLVKIRNTILRLAIDIGSLLTPEIEYLSVVIRKVEKFWGSLTERTQKAIIYIGLATVAIGALVGVFVTFGAVAAAISSASGVIMQMFQLLAALSQVSTGIGIGAAGSVSISLGPVAMAIVGITAAVTGLIYLFYGTKGLIAAWDYISSAAMKAFNVIATGFGLWWHLVSSFTKVIFTDFSKFPKIMENLGHNIGVVFKAIGRIMTSILASALMLVFTKDFWAAIYAGLKGAIGLYAKFFIAVSAMTAQALMGAFTGTAGFIAAVEDSLKAAFDDLGKKIGGESLGDQITRIIKEANSDFTNLLEGTGLEEKLQKSLVDPLQEAGQVVNDVKDTLKQPFNMRFESSGIEAVLAGTGAAFDIAKNHLLQMNAPEAIFNRFMGADSFATAPLQAHLGPGSEDGLAETNSILGQILTELKTGGTEKKMEERIKPVPMRVD